jgi:hypothetical protein
VKAVLNARFVRPYLTDLFLLSKDTGTEPRTSSLACSIKPNKIFQAFVNNEQKIDNCTWLLWICSPEILFPSLGSPLVRTTTQPQSLPRRQERQEKLGRWSNDCSRDPQWCELASVDSSLVVCEPRAAIVFAPKFPKPASRATVSMGGLISQIG